MSELKPSNEERNTVSGMRLWECYYVEAECPYCYDKNRTYKGCSECGSDFPQGSKYCPNCVFMVVD